MKDRPAVPSGGEGRLGWTASLRGRPLKAALHPTHPTGARQLHPGLHEPHAHS